MKSVFVSVHGRIGILKNVLHSSIFLLTSFENSRTCFSIYLRKAFDDHLPIIMIVYGGVFARYIIIAPPERLECVPTSLLVNPRTWGPIASTIALISMIYSAFDRYEIFLPSWYVYTGHFGLKFG